MTLMNGWAVLSRHVQTRPQLLNEDTDSSLDLFHSIEDKILTESLPNELHPGLLYVKAKRSGNTPHTTFGNDLVFCHHCLVCVWVGKVFKASLL